MEPSSIKLTLCTVVLYAQLYGCISKTIWVKNTDNENVLCSAAGNFRAITAVKSKCFFFSNDMRNYEGSIAYCKAIAEPLQLDNEEEYKILSKLNGNRETWIGIKYNFNENNGTTRRRVSQNIVKYIKTLTRQGGNDCGALIPNSDQWIASQCGTQKNYICQSNGEIQKEVCTETKYRGKNEKITTCYFSLETSNYWEAGVKCQKNNATLAMPKTGAQWKESSSYINKIWNSIETQKVWIGVNFKPRGTNWLWADEKIIYKDKLPFVYTQSAFLKPNSNFGKCGIIIKQGRNLVMNTEHCGNTKALTFCQIEKREALPTTTAKLIQTTVATKETTKQINTTEMISSAQSSTASPVIVNTTIQTNNVTSSNATLAAVKRGKSTGIIIGVVIGILCLLAILVFVCALCIKRKRSKKTISEIKKQPSISASNHASEANKETLSDNYPPQMQWNNNIKPLGANDVIMNNHVVEPPKHTLQHSCSMPPRPLPTHKERNRISAPSISINGGPVAVSTLSNQIKDSPSLNNTKTSKERTPKVKLRKRVTAPILRLSGFAMANRKNIQTNSNGVKGYYNPYPLEFPRPDNMAVDSDFSSFTSWDDSDQESVIHSTELQRKQLPQNGKRKRNSFHLAYVNITEPETIDSQTSLKNNTNRSHSYVNIDPKTIKNLERSMRPDVVPISDTNEAHNNCNLLTVPKFRNQHDTLPAPSRQTEMENSDRPESMISQHIYETIPIAEEPQSPTTRDVPNNKKSIKKIISKATTKRRKSIKTIKQSGEIGPDIIQSTTPINQNQTNDSTWDIIATPAIIMIDKSKKKEENELETIAENHSNLSDAISPY